ncbi:class I SAM-dependent methyltransferase, partial [Balneolaceae bacterium ANBcel3]|nr:class I SAM-dependent methyltransferase [Balneolaceae bacterium ANBcel3]
YRKQRFDFKSASHHLYVPISEHRIPLKKSPEIGWLSRLYSDQPEFFLPFTIVQGLNSSWQWYTKGIKYPVLPHRLHPWYGTYFPTRFDHLFLFEKWLKRNANSKESVIDMGAGSGVLTFMMIRHGYEHLSAVDIHPNALNSIHEDAERIDCSQRISLVHSDLFDQVKQKADLIVCNPPWLAAEHPPEGMDQAIFYEEEFFNRFFAQSLSVLNPGGKLLVFFSNIGLQADYQSIHPVTRELEEHNRFKKVNRYIKKVSSPSKKTRRRHNRDNEFVELWELEKV